MLKRSVNEEIGLYRVKPKSVKIKVVRKSLILKVNIIINVTGLTMGSSTV